jgi:urea transporter
MAPDELNDPARSRIHAGFSLLRDTILRSYSQILFSRSLIVGGLLLSATALEPRVGAVGLLSVALAAAVAFGFRFAHESIRAGLFGYNALLVGVGAAALLPPTPVSTGLTAVAVLTVVLSASAIQAALGPVFNLPALTLPFLFVFYLLLGAAPIFGQDLALGGAPGLLPEETLPEFVSQYLRSLGAIFFLPRTDVGLVVLAAILVYSRIAFLLSLLGYGIASLVVVGLLEGSTGFLPLVVGYNFILVSIALGGVWFVPSFSSFIIAAVGTFVSGLVAVGLLALLAPMGIPLLILPFNATVLLILYAMRARIEDQDPKSVDFAPGTPEQNLNYFRTRLARFGTRHWIRFRAPFLGTWTCTQGVDGEISHRGPWRHAYDFEVADANGVRFTGDGSRAEDYLCFGLPVLAAADGQVVLTCDDVPDNAVGELNLRQNWGNHVVLQHAPGLYSMVAHLQPGSVGVSVGQFVRSGDELGRCGLSGRAAVPHIHFQLQRTGRLGDSTSPSELHEIVVSGENEDRLRATLVPEEGQHLRGIQRDDDVVRRFAFPYREPLTFRIQEDGRSRQETLIGDIDNLGNLMLRSITRHAQLYYDLSEDVFVVHDTIGARASVLHLIHAALPRVPFELTPRILWTDHLPRRRFIPWAARPLLDLVSPFYSGEGPTMRYRARRVGSQLEIVGRSDSRSGPEITTLASFSSRRGLERIEITVGRRTTVALREEADQAAMAESQKSH